MKCRITEFYVAHMNLKFNRREKKNKDDVVEIVKPTSGCENHSEDGDCGDQSC